jgi:glycosyltransferase involved in cell wall biosynthesis
MSVLLSHPHGNANFRNTALSLYEANWLHSMHSSICWNSNSRIGKYLPTNINAELNRRAFSMIPLSYQHSHPWPEVARLLAQKLHMRGLTINETTLFSPTRIRNSFDRQIASSLERQPDNIRAVYGYENSALSTFKVAARLGISRIYELPIGYYKAGNRIFQEEAELQGAWASTLNLLKSSTSSLARKDAELAASDCVIVPSSFVRSTLETDSSIDVPIHLVPYGSPPPTQMRSPKRAQGPLRVLFVGGLGQRKGLSYLLEAVQMLGSAVQLTLIGSRLDTTCEPLNRALAIHTWHPSLPHSAILEQMRRHDVLVLPSLFEGYALVITEALSQGLPVIATANSGATESVRNGVEGFIVPIRDSHAIATHLLELHQDHDQLAEMSAACLDRAAELSWQAYRASLRTVLAPLLEES